MKLCKHLQSKTKEELYKKASLSKNRKNEAAFLKIPYSQRVVFVPHCMRNIEKCRTHEVGSYYICAECGGCKIDNIQKKAKELGYKGVFILKGGRSIKKLVGEVKPQAVVGVACFYESTQGITMIEDNNLAVQFVPLTKDGCIATDVEVEEVYKTLTKTDSKP